MYTGFLQWVHLCCVLVGLFQIAGNSEGPGFLFSWDLADELEESRGSTGAQETNTITAVARFRLLGEGNSDLSSQHRQRGCWFWGRGPAQACLSLPVLLVSWFLPHGSTSCPSIPCSVCASPFFKGLVGKGPGTSWTDILTSPANPWSCYVCPGEWGHKTQMWLITQKTPLFLRKETWVWRALGVPGASVLAFCGCHHQSSQVGWL